MGRSGLLHPSDKSRAAYLRESYFQKATSLPISISSKGKTFELSLELSRKIRESFKGSVQEPAIFNVETITFDPFSDKNVICKFGPYERQFSIEPSILNAYLTEEQDSEEALLDCIREVVQNPRQIMVGLEMDEDLTLADVEKYLC